MSEQSNVLSAALLYAERGWCPIPLKANDKRPYVDAWQKEASADPAKVRAWFTNPRCNIGIATGSKSGFFVVDCDETKGEHGIATFKALVEANGTPEALETLIQITPTGGRHYLYLQPEGMIIKNSVRKKLGAGVDVRGDGGQIAVEPSVRPEGAYKWDETYQIREAPAWLLEMVRDKPVERRTTTTTSTPADWRPATRGNNTGNVDAYVQKAVEAECIAVADAYVGTRNDTLNRAAYNLGQLVGGGVLDEGDARAALEMAAANNGMEADDGVQSVLKTIDSGLRSGMANPRTVPDREYTRPVASQPPDYPIPPAPAPTRAPARANAIKNSKSYPIQTSFYNDCVVVANRDDISNRFGLSVDTINRFNIGMAFEYKQPDLPDLPATKRVIVPITDRAYAAYYVGDVHKNDAAWVEKFGLLYYGYANVFNVDALKENKGPVFVVQSEMDALAVLDRGFEAVAIGAGDNSSIKVLVEAVKKHRPIVPLVVCMPNTPDGNLLADELEASLNSIGMADLYVCRRDLSYGNDSVHAAFMKDRDVFASVVTDVEQAVRGAWSQDYLNKVCALPYMDTFLAHTSKKREIISTGFKLLDEKLGGGLYPAFYIVGGMSSNGKTTICSQIVDQVAEAGHDVLIFTLEQSRDELIAKTLSRYTQEGCVKHGLSTSLAKTMRGILDGHFNMNLPEERTIMDEAYLRYKAHADHIFMVEGNDTIGVDHIRKAVQKHIAFCQSSPVVLVDYLQVLPPISDKMTDKQVVDRNVSALRRISRDFDIPVIVISSLNRQSYDEVVSVGSLKESGSIEYSADVVLGLNIQGFDAYEGKTDAKKKERKEFLKRVKAADSRVIELSVLKNRNGKADVSCLFDYWPKFNRFREKPEEKAY